MSEKRFTTSDPTVEYSKFVTIVWDSKKYNHLIVDEVVDLLNEQEDRIEFLEAENMKLQKELDDFNPVMFQDRRRGTVILYSKRGEY